MGGWGDLAAFGLLQAVKELFGAGCVDQVVGVRTGFVRFVAVGCLDRLGVLAGGRRRWWS